MTNSCALRARHMRYVAAPLRDATIDYMMANMLPDDMHRCIGSLAAKIIEDAVAAHRVACKRIKEPVVAPGWPTVEQRMGRR